MEAWNNFGVWLAALFTLGIISFLYRDNIFYKICEAIFVGISAGYWFITFFWDNLYGKFYTQVTDPVDPQIAPWFGFILGMLMLSRLFGKIGWLSRWPLAFVIGATAGVYMMFYFVSNAMLQIEATIMPIYGGSFGATISNIFIIGGTFCGLVYFFFSKEHKGVFGGMAKVGIWFLMATFGASFGYTVMSRMSLMLGRLDFLFGTWLGMIK
jgi:hypothetical protein